DVGKPYRIGLRALARVNRLVRPNAEDAFAPRPVGTVGRVAVHVPRPHAAAVVATHKPIRGRVLFVLPRPGVAGAQVRRNDRLPRGAQPDVVADRALGPRLILDGAGLV